MTGAVANELPHAPGPHVSAGEPGDGHHDPHLAHQFENMQQQFAAGKLGIWLFLITEVLFFSGLFVAYAVFRSTHPEVFLYAHHFLDKSLGALNTVVLICSSLTMAWAVRSAQLGHQRALVNLLTVTLACASFFLGVKAVEYSHKWDEGILWGAWYGPTHHHAHSESAASTVGSEARETTATRADSATVAVTSVAMPSEQHGHDSGHHTSVALQVLSLPAAVGLLFSLGLGMWGHIRRRSPWKVVGFSLALTAATYFLGVAAGQWVPVVVSGTAATTSSSSNPHPSPDPTRAMAHADGAAPQSPHHDDSGHVPEMPEPAGVGLFFSIYYVMTGLHAIHILAGMGVIVWLLINSVGGMYGPNYFGPVDYVGLYWHLVDLVWIYLFPLLYLIH
jgi:cytochrome c oxidase subunit III